MREQTHVTNNNGVVVVESVVECERLQFAIVFTVIEVARVSLNELVETVSAELVCVCAKNSNNNNNNNIKQRLINICNKSLMKGGQSGTHRLSCAIFACC